ncbi:hypothetical protein K1T71_006858 [Dendrolimus kikuchii]|uniref:Uncharacterized protein n=1 Tax=Dendrolimus kikuchii TaxID=765133 RepID=A0ACC1D2E1_9NEOP|nr:hypothetical protein K1T71_006858 [Dendrolimus kikuchii]
MNIILILCTASIFTGATCAVEGIKNHREQRTLLRKLQNFHEDTKPQTWNEILADVFVNRIKIFSSKTDENKETDYNVLKHLFSQALVFYKKFVYDKIVFRDNVARDKTAIFKPEIESNEVPHGIGIDRDKRTDIKNPGDPKKDIELIEPEYHGKISMDNTTEDPNTNKNECPEGFVKNDSGCVNENSKLILAVPGQCPDGYRRDRLGYCRMKFFFWS